MHTTQQTEIRLHFDNFRRIIWYCDETGETVTSTDRDPWEFVSHELCDTESVRLLGLPTNASLIAWLYQSREQHGFPLSVKIGTPVVCNNQHLKNPAQIMFQMQEVNGLLGCAGGWREITRHDFASALVQCSFQEGKFENLDEILSDHPAWAAISFVPTGDMLESARLLAEIGDPRWFVDPDKPERFSRLRSYLGLTQRNIRYVCGWDHNNYGPGHNHERCRLTLNAWLGSHNNARHAACFSQPRDFLRRCVHRYPVANGDGTAKGILRALNMYVNFIRLVWLETATPHGGELFAPDHFFAAEDDQMRPKVIQAWKSHVDRLYH